MVTAISSASTTSTTTVSASTSNADIATLKAELAAKQSELSEAKTDDEKTKINAEITKLKAAIAAAKTSDKQDTQQTSKSGSKTDGSKSETAQVTSADKAAPEGKVSGAAMDVLMRLSPQGGMMGGPSGPGGPMSISDIYSQIDADSDGKVTKDEFVSGRDKHMSEDQATKLFASIDTTNTGSITEDQFAKSIQQGDHDGHRMGPPPGFPRQDDWSSASTTSTSTTSV